MAKRLPLKEFGRTTKKPKLDISIQRGRPAPSQSWPHAVRKDAAVPVSRRATSPLRSSPINNLWDDDEDDDVILLATQVAEQQVAARQLEAAAAAIANITESELTFSEFAPHVHASTSTQQVIVRAPAPPPTVVNFPDADVLSEMFADDDDDFNMLVDEEQNGFGGRKKVATPFKKPSVGAQKPFTASQTGGERQQVAFAHQMNSLTERLKALEAEKDKLLSQLQSKDGEATLLRDELRHMKQQEQRIKMEQKRCTEAVESENKAKIAELSKKLEAIEMELRLKQNECSALKMRHADETQRLEMSMRGTFAPHSTTSQSAKQARMLQRMRGLALSQLEPIGNDCSLSLETSAHIYEQSQERGATKRQRTVFQLELEELQTLMAQIQIKQQQQHCLDVELQPYIARIIESVCKVFTEFWSYVHSLEFPKNCNIHPQHDYALQRDESGARSSDKLLHCRELYKDERAVCLRRYVVALSVLCRQLPQLSIGLLTREHGQYKLLQIATDAIAKLGFSREICAHFGVLEAFAMLLHVLLLQAQPADDAEQLALLVNLLKQLAFTRPSAWIFRVLGCCLWECVRLPNALALLCVNSDERSFSSDRMRSVYRFSNESCLLQVYSGLLEISFPLNVPLERRHFELLAVICAQHVRFVHHCFAQPPAFIHKLLPSYDDDDEEENEMNACTGSTVSAPTSTSRRCECYTKLCLSVVTLLYQLLRQWMRTNKEIETSRVAEVSRMAVQLLHTIFCDNYTTLLFRDAEETTKHYLWLISTWWAENSSLLDFNDIQLNFLSKLQSFHIMPRSISEEKNVENVAIDLAEWHSLTNEVTKDVESSAQQADVADPAEANESALEKFFVGLRGYAFNFE